LCQQEAVLGLFNRDKVVARGSFGRKDVDDLFEFRFVLIGGVEIQVGKGIPKDG
jgi:hypothetical protein